MGSIYKFTLIPTFFFLGKYVGAQTPTSRYMGTPGATGLQGPVAPNTNLYLRIKTTLYKTILVKLWTILVLIFLASLYLSSFITILLSRTPPLFLSSLLVCICLLLLTIVLRRTPLFTRKENSSSKN